MAIFKAGSNITIRHYSDIFIKYKKAILMMVFLSIVINLTSLVVPLSFMAIVDRVLVSSNYSSLYVIVSIILFSHFSAVVLSSTNGYLFNWLSVNLNSAISAKFYKKLLFLNSKYFDQYPLGDCLSRIAEIHNIKDFISEWLLSFSIQIVFMVIFLAVMFSLSAEMTLIVMFSVPFHFSLYFIFSKALRRKENESFEEGVKYNDDIVENILGLRTLRFSNKRSKAVEKILLSFHSTVKKDFELANIRLISGQSSAAISKVFESILLLVGALLVLDQKLTLGELLAFNMMKDRVLSPLLRLTSIWEEIIKFKNSYGRVEHVFSASEEMSMDEENHVRMNLNNYDIIFKSVSFAYQNNEVLKDINLVIKEGEGVCIFGESGAGKSTLTKLLGMEYDDYSGKITLGGKDIRQININTLRNNISYVHQSSNMFNGSILDNIMLENDSNDMEIAVESAKVAGIHDFILGLPDGYKTYLRSGSLSLSGGQIQRLAIARSVASGRRIIVLDEATSALDYETERDIIDNLIKEKKNKTLIIISHRVSLAKLSEHIVYLKGGEIVESGTHDQLISNENNYANLINIQLHEKMVG